MAGGAGGKVKNILFLVTCLGKPGKPLSMDDHMTCRTGHLAFARPFEGLSYSLSNLEQGCTFLPLSLRDCLPISAFETWRAEW